MSNVAQIYLNDKELGVRWSQVKEDFWGDLKRETNLAISRLLTSTMEVQVQDLIGIPKGKHSIQRTNNCNGYRYRGLLTSFGYINSIKIPRIRSGSIVFNCIPRYKQRAEDIDALVLEMFLAGVSVRRVEEVLTPLCGPKSISASSVSSITK